MKKFDERNVAILEDIRELPFLRGIWRTGTSFKVESKVLCITVGGKNIPKMCCLEQHSY